MSSARGLEATAPFTATVIVATLTTVAGVNRKEVGHALNGSCAGGGGAVTNLVAAEGITKIYSVFGVGCRCDGNAELDQGISETGGHASLAGKQWLQAAADDLHINWSNARVL